MPNQEQPIYITLVNPSHPGNIGAVARAMKNMGFVKLRLVKPQRPVDNTSIARAAGAIDVLENAEYFETLKEAIADCQLVIGSSARSNVPDVKSLTAKEAALFSKEALPQKVALLLGREHAGLTNQELALCHYHLQIPCNPNFSSLNLGAAAQIICYELFLALSHKADQTKLLTEELASQDEFEALFAHFETTLAHIDFYDPNNPRRLMPKLRALYNRAQLQKSEVNILRGILTAIDKVK